MAKPKQDTGKRRWILMPWKALCVVQDVLDYGASKYEDDGWRRQEKAVERYSSATMRHLAAYLSGEHDDPETGLPHLAHICCNALFLLELDPPEHHG